MTPVLAVARECRPFLRIVNKSSSSFLLPKSFRRCNPRAVLEWAHNEFWEREDYMPTGTVKWFNATKGFGFIEPDDGGQDAFVHISALERAGISGLSEGQKVQYDLEPGRDGKSAAGNLVAID